MDFYDGNGNRITVSDGGGAPSFLRGTKYIAFGDSLLSNQSTNEKHEIYNGTDMQGIVHTDEVVRGYAMDIEDRYGVICEKHGESGGTIVRNYATAVAQDYSKASIATFAFGTNDARTGIDLGTADSVDHQTFAGCLNGILRKVYMDNSDCKVIVITPPQRLIVNDFGSFTANSKGKTLEDFANMAKAVSARRSTVCADVFHDSGLNQQTLYYYTREGVHPTNGGYSRLTNVIAPLFDQMLTIKSNLFHWLVIPASPLSQDGPVVDVPLTQNLFTKDGIQWNSTDEPGLVGSATQVGKGIKLLNGKTYLYQFYSTYDGLPERNYAVNDSESTIVGSGTWDKWSRGRGSSLPHKEIIGGETYYKWESAIAVPNEGNYYIWPAYRNALGVESLRLRYY